MILEPSLPFMSFPLEELSETARRSDRFLGKSQLSGESHGSSIPGTGESDRRPSQRVVLGWDYHHEGSRNRQFGNHRVRRYGSAGRSIKEDLEWADSVAGYVVRL